MASYLTVYTTELRRMANKPTQNISQITVKMWHHVDKELITIVQNGIKTRKI